MHSFWASLVYLLTSLLLPLVPFFSCFLLPRSQCPLHLLPPFFCSDRLSSSWPSDSDLTSATHKAWLWIERMWNYASAGNGPANKRRDWSVLWMPQCWPLAMQAFESKDLPPGSLQESILCAEGAPLVRGLSGAQRPWHQVLPPTNVTSKSDQKFCTAGGQDLLTSLRIHSVRQSDVRHQFGQPQKRWISFEHHMSMSRWQLRG